MTRNGAVGVVGSVVDPSGTFATAAGRRSLRGGLAKPQDCARIASVTKGMIATMAFQQIEAGGWSLSTTIDDVARGLYPGRGSVTVAQLMNHTSGMPDAIYTVLGGDDLFAFTPQQLTAAIGRMYPERELVRIATGLPWLFEPGQGLSYSNTGYVVLSIMLEEATGTRIEDLIRERIFKPAGMHQSRLEESTLVRGRHLVPVARFASGPVELDQINPSIFSGAGGVYATAEDVTDFTGALMTGKLVSQRSVDLMSTPVGAAARFGMGYGLYTIKGPCLDRTGAPETLIGHDGAGFGTETLSFTTRDGARRMSLAWTGRSYTEAGPWPDANAVLLAAFQATCPGGMTTHPRRGTPAGEGTGMHL